MSRLLLCFHAVLIPLVAMASVARAALTGPMVTEALDSGTSVVWEAPYTDWSVVTGPAFTRDGVDGLKAPVLGSAAKAEVWGRIAGPGILRGWVRVSSEPLQDVLQLSVGGVLVREWSGEREQEFEIPMPIGPQELKFTWKQDSGRTGGANAAWLDEVVFTPSVITAEEALDVAGSPSAGRVRFSLPAGSVPWTGADVGTEAWLGGDVLFSSSADSGPLRRLQVSVDGPSLVMFRAKRALSAMASPVLHPQLQGGVQLLGNHTDGNWTVYRVLVTGAVGQFSLSHGGSLSGGAGEDGLFLDALTVAPLASVSLTEALDVPGQAFTMGWGSINGGPPVNEPWLAVEPGAASGMSRNGGDVLLAPRPALGTNELAASGSRFLTTRVTGPGRLGFWCRVVDRQEYNPGYLAYRVKDPAGIEKEQGSELRSPSSEEWQQRVMEIPPGVRDVTLTWGSGKDLLALDEFVWSSTPLEVPAPTVPAAVDLSGALAVTSAGNWAAASWNQAGLTDDDAVTWTPYAAAPASDNPAHRFQATATGEGWLSFGWQTGGVGGINFVLNGEVKGLGTALTLADPERPGLSWWQVARRLPAGTHALGWAAGWAASGDSRVLGRGAVRLDGLSHLPHAPSWLEAMDVPPDLTEWQMGGGPWQRVTGETHDGVDALRSPELTAGAGAGIHTRIQGPGTLHFWWKMGDPEPVPDQLGRLQTNTFKFSGEGHLRQLTSQSGWKQESLEISQSYPFDFSWFFQRSDRATLPGDGAWLDEVRFVRSTPTTVAEAMDTPMQAWTSSGAVEALAGGGLAAATDSDLVRLFPSQPLPGWIETTVQGSGMASVRASFQSQYLVDGSPVETHFRQGRYWFKIFGAGPHQCRFECPQPYSLDLDDFQFTPMALVSLEEALDQSGPVQLTLEGNLAGSSGVADTVNSADGVDVLRLNHLLVGSDSWQGLRAVFQGPSRVRFRWRGEGPGDAEYSLSTSSIQGKLTGDFVWDEVVLIVSGLGENTLFIKAAGSSTSAPRTVWIDQLVVEPLVASPLPAALHAGNLTFTTGGSASWAGWRPPGASSVPSPGDGSYAGVKLPAGAPAPAWLETQVTGPGWLHFTASVANTSQVQLDLTLDGQAVTATGSRLHIPAGVHAVRWAARYRAASWMNVPSAELRDVRFEPALSLEEGLDISGIPLLSSAQPGGYWYGSPKTSLDSALFTGDDVVQLAGNGDLTFSLNGPGWLRFESGWPARTATPGWPLDTGVRLRLLPGPPVPEPNPLPNPVFEHVSGFISTAGAYRTNQVMVPAGSWQARFTGKQAATLNHLRFIPTLPDAADAAASALNLPAGIGLTLYPDDSLVSLAPVSHDGVQALQLATPKPGITPVIRFSLQGPALLGGWLRTSLSQPSSGDVGGQDFINGINGVRLSVDGVPVSMDWAAAGADGWRAWQLPVTASGPQEVVFALHAMSPPLLLQLDQITLGPLTPLPLSNALDAPDLPWITGGPGLWQGFATAAASQDGVNAALVTVPAGQPVDPPSWMETEIMGPGSFGLMMQGRGTLQVQLAGQGVFSSANPGGTSGAWRTASLLIPPGLQKIRISALPQVGLAGLFAVDQITWVPGTLTDLAGAMDAPALTFAVTGGPSAWQPLALPAYTQDGEDAVLVRGPLTAPTAMETTVTGPAVLAFWRMLHHPATFDFTVNGAPVRQQPTSSTIGIWRREECIVPAGTHQLRWTLTPQAGITLSPLDLLLRLDGLTLTPLVPGPSLAEAVDQPGWMVRAGSPEKVRTLAFAPTEWTPEDAVLITGNTSNSASSPETWPALTATVPGPGILHYRWRPYGLSSYAPDVSVEGGTGAASPGNDRMILSGVGDGWFHGWVVVPAGGAREVTWKAQGLHHGYWLDDLFLEPGIPPGIAAGAPELVWSTGGKIPWMGNPELSSSDQTIPPQAVASLAGPGSSWLEVELSGPGRLKFTSGFSAGGSSMVHGNFYVDGRPIRELTSQAASDYVLIVPPGQHRFRWALESSSPPAVSGSYGKMNLRQVQFVTSAGVDPVAEALDAPGLPWLIEGNIPGWQSIAGSAPGEDVLSYIPGSSGVQSSLTTVLPVPSAVMVHSRTQGSIRTSAGIAFDTEGWAAYRIPLTMPVSSRISFQISSFGASPLPSVAEFDQFSYVPVTLSLGEALDAPGQVWETDPEAPFLGYAADSTISAYDGVDAAMAGKSAEGAWLQTSVEGSCRISFRQYGNGGRILLDGRIVPAPITDGWSYWNYIGFETGPGRHVLRWEKTGPLPWGIDSFQAVPLAVENTMAEALDFPETWLWFGPQEPAISRTDTSDGQDAVLVTGAADGFGLEVIGPGRLQFSAKAPWNFHEKTGSSVLLQTTTGAEWRGLYSGSWTPHVINTIPPGPQVLRWPVSNSDGILVGRDQVGFVPYVPVSLSEGLDVSGLGVTTNPAEPWQGWKADSAAHDGQDVVISSSSTDSWLEITVPAGAGELRLMARSPSHLAAAGSGLRFTRGDDITAMNMPLQWKQMIYPVEASGPRTIRLSKTRTGDLWVDKLAFIPAAAAMAEWLTAHGLPPGTPSDSDSDGDGIPLLLEYAFGLDASRHGQPDLGVPPQAGLPVFDLEKLSGGRVLLRCRYLRRTGGRGLRYEVRFSHEPSTAGAAPATQSVYVTTLSNDWELVTASDFLAGEVQHPSRFGRVWVFYDP